MSAGHAPEAAHGAEHAPAAAHAPAASGDRPLHTRIIEGGAKKSWGLLKGIGKRLREVLRAPFNIIGKPAVNTWNRVLGPLGMEITGEGSITDIVRSVGNGVNKIVDWTTHKAKQGLDIGGQALTTVLYGPADIVDWTGKSIKAIFTGEPPAGDHHAAHKGHDAHGSDAHGH